MSSVSKDEVQQDTQDIVPARPWKTVFNKRFGQWVIHHHMWCERGETSTLFTIHTTLNDEKDAAVAAFVVAAVNAYKPPDHRGCLPDCMMPDGADPCIGYHATLARIAEIEARPVLRLTASEVQSGHDRQRYAEGLILQLPAGHDGRDSWLLNYGTGETARQLRAKRGLAFDERSRAINPPASA